VRRALIADVPAIAPSSVVIDVNTTSHTDEFVTQHLGLIPFQQDDDVDAASLEARVHVTGRAVRGTDVVGWPVSYPEAELVKMAPDQELALTIHFERSTGADHARFARAVAVGMCPTTPDEDEWRISFESNFADDHAHCALQALDAVERELRRARAIVLEAATP